MKKKYLIVGIISILIMMIGVTYAYFTGMIVGEGAPITVKAKKLSIVFTDTEKIGGTQIVPGWNVSKTFTVENKSGSVFYYDINIDDLVNTFITEGYLQYKITSTDGGYNMTEYVDITKSNEAKREKLAGTIEIADKETHTYKVEFQYVDSDEDQSVDMGKIFGGSLSITESEIIVVKYKVNNIIQDELPDKTEPYITSTVTCSNNAEGIWNEEKETVELTKVVKQTVCIVEFKEGYTVTLNMDESSGSVVAPTSKVVGRIGKAEFQININNGYDINKGTVTCENGAEIKIEGLKVTVTNIKQDTVCTIVPKGIDYTVTYNPNNGSGVNPTSNIVTFGEKYKLPVTNPTRTGYTFAGWFTEASGGTEVTTSTKVTTASNHIIYAHWTINSYNVTLTVKNGSVTTTNPLSINYGGSGKFTIKASDGYKLDGATYTCTGWSYDQNGTVTVSGVTGTTSCTIALVQGISTFTMGGGNSGTNKNDDTDACFIIKHKSTTATYGGKKYKNCTILNNSVTFGSSDTIVEWNYSAGSYNRWVSTHRDSDGQWCCSSVYCSVTLTCNLA